MTIIEEYLVKIGADIDRNAFSGAAQAINQMAGAMGRLGNILKYGAVITALVKTTEAITQNIKAVAEADMEYQKLAKTMWVTKETAKAFSIVTKTMGASAEDIAWIPELREQFFRLRAEMAELQTPADSAGQLRWIREIGYDVQSLQIKLKMLREWIVYYLIKYLRPYIAELQGFIRWIGEKLGQNMPEIARRIAIALRSVVVLGVSAMRALKSVYEAISGFFTRLPDRTKKMVAAFAAAGAAIMAGPFGLFIAAIGGALLLLEDFWAYVDGRKSSKKMAPLWKWLTDKDNPLKKIIQDIEKAITNILNRLSELFGKVFTEERQERIKETVAIIGKGLVDIASVLSDIIAKLTGNNIGIVNLFWNNFVKGVNYAIDKVLILGRATGKLLSALKKAWDGDYKGAASDLKSAFGEIGGSIKDDLLTLYHKISGGDDGGERGQYAYKKLLSMGYTPVQAAGIVGNLIQENSNLDPSLSNSIGATGIAQWLGGRLDALKAFAARKGTSWNDFNTQLEFIDHEMRGTESYAYRELQKAKTPEEAAYIVRKYYERPGEDEANDEARMGNARAVYDRNQPKLHGSTPKPADSGYKFDLGVNWPISGTSYAAALMNGQSIMPMTNITHQGAAINVGGIVVNCGQSSNPREIANAVGAKTSDVLLKLAARTGGGVLV